MSPLALVELLRDALFKTLNGTTQLPGEEPGFDTARVPLSSTDT